MTFPSATTDSKGDLTVGIYGTKKTERKIRAGVEIEREAWSDPRMREKKKRQKR